MLWKKLASAYKSKLKLNIFEIRENLRSITLQNSRDVDIYASQIDRNVKDYNLWVGPMTTDTDAADTDASAKTITKMSGKEYIFYLLRRIRRNDEWKAFLELMMRKNVTMTTTPDEIITKLVEKEAAIKRANGLAPEALLFAKKGGRGGRGGKVGKSPKRDKRDDKRVNMDDRKEMDFRKCFHCQRQRHTTGNCLPSNVAILQSLPTLQQKQQLKHPLLQLSPRRSRTIGWWLAQMLHLVIGSSIADAQLTCLAVDRCLSPTPNILWIWRKWSDTMGSHRLHPDMEVLGWLASCQMERQKRSYVKKWCICRDHSMLSHSHRWWKRMSKSNRWITTVSPCSIAKASWLPLHLRSKSI